MTKPGAVDAQQTTTYFQHQEISIASSATGCDLTGSTWQLLKPMAKTWSTQTSSGLTRHGRSDTFEYVMHGDCAMRTLLCNISPLRSIDHRGLPNAKLGQVQRSVLVTSDTPPCCIGKRSISRNAGTQYYPNGFV